MVHDSHHRHSIRLKNWDYSSPGYYFVTICSCGRQPIFGEIVDGETVLSEIGKIAIKCWKEIPQHYQCVELNEFIIMPNHIHGIIIIKENVNDVVGAQYFVPQKDVQRVEQGVQNIEPLRVNKFQHVVSGSLGQIVRGFKIGVTEFCRNNEIMYSVWQRNFYDHIIRNEKDMYNIQGYILNNPSKWQADLENLQLYKHWTEREREYFVQSHYDELFGK